MPIAFPWHCLVCPCVADKGEPPPSGPADYIASLLQRSGGDPLTREEGDGAEKDRYVSKVVEQLPEHMQLLRSRDDPNGKHLGKIAKERDLGGFTLIDLSAAK